jgi:hypothetical protein
LNERWAKVANVFWKRNIMIAAALMDGMLYTGLAIVMLVGTVMMVMGVVAEK